MKRSWLLIIMMLATYGCGEAGVIEHSSLNGETASPENLSAPILIRGYAGISPIFGARIAAWTSASSPLLGSATTDRLGQFSMEIPSLSDVDLVTFAAEEGVYLEPVGEASATVSQDGLKTILLPNELSAPVVITPFTDMLAALYDFSNRSALASDPLQQARAVMSDYFHIDFLKTLPADHPDAEDTDDAKRYQFLIDGLSQMATDLGLESSFALTKAFSTSLRFNGNMSGMTPQGTNIMLGSYRISFNSLRVDFVNALETIYERLWRRRGLRSIHDYLTHLRTHSSILFGLSVYE